MKNKKPRKSLDIVNINGTLSLFDTSTIDKEKWQMHENVKNWAARMPKFVRDQLCNFSARKNDDDDDDEQYRRDEGIRIGGLSGRGWWVG